MAPEIPEYIQKRRIADTSYSEIICTYSVTDQLHLNRRVLRFQRNMTMEEIDDLYHFFINNDKCVGYEVTFTINPKKSRGIQEAKKTIMTSVCKKFYNVPGFVGCIFTRENHESGWPHIHGIMWFLKEVDNSKMLSSVYGDGRSQIGRVQVDSLRVDEYVDAEGNNRENWLDYICKEQGNPWQVANVIFNDVYTPIARDVWM